MNRLLPQVFFPLREAYPDHLIFDGIYILRRNKWMIWSTYIGLLVRSSDLVRLAQE